MPLASGISWGEDERGSLGLAGHAPPETNRNSHSRVDHAQRVVNVLSCSNSTCGAVRGEPCQGTKQAMRTHAMQLLGLAELPASRVVLQGPDARNIARMRWNGHYNGIPSETFAAQARCSLSLMRGPGAPSPAGRWGPGKKWRAPPFRRQSQRRPRNVHVNLSSDQVQMGRGLFSFLMHQRGLVSKIRMAPGRTPRHVDPGWQGSPPPTPAAPWPGAAAWSQSEQSTAGTTPEL